MGHGSGLDPAELMLVFLEMHSPADQPGRSVCQHDGSPWPCPPVLALAEVLIGPQASGAASRSSANPADVEFADEAAAFRGEPS
ncbi:hypothetical protein [Actinomadura sp. 6N118]|uniref:hypothetical protein n=1 Tax=Actinomadura sp. 6N118 TaxID=3375151 RepID=UPI0037909422